MQNELQKKKENSTGKVCNSEIVKKALQLIK